MVAANLPIQRRIRAALGRTLSVFLRSIPYRNKPEKVRGASQGRCLSSSSAENANPSSADWADRVAAWKQTRQGYISVSMQNIANANYTKLQKIFASHSAFATLVTEVGVGVGYSESNFHSDLHRINPDLAAICVPRRICSKRSGGVALVCAGEMLGGGINKVTDYDEFDWLLAVEIHLQDRKNPLGLVVCYTPGSGKYYQESMFTNLGRVMRDLSSRTSGVVVAGDFNFRLGGHRGSEWPWINQYFRRRSMDCKSVNVKRGGLLMAAGGIALSGRVPGDLRGEMTNYHQVDGGGTLIDDAFVDLGAFPDVRYCQKGIVDRSVSTHVPITYWISRESFWEHHDVRPLLVT